LPLGLESILVCPSTSLAHNDLMFKLYTEMLPTDMLGGKLFDKMK
jgi:hypothetical protein